MPVKVKDEYRTNPLSVEPGGHEVTVIHEGGKTFIYDKVKRPGAYIKGISSVTQTKNGPIIKINIDGEEVWNVRHDETEPWDSPAIKNLGKK
jgi:hypothetical protein